MYFNGDPTPEVSIPLVGTMGPHGTFVIAHASAAFLDRADQTNDWAGLFNVRRD